MEQKKMWRVVYEMKMDLVSKIEELVGERTIDVSDDNINVSAVERHGGEALHGGLMELNEDGFILDFDATELPWSDMVVEDLAMVHDYLLTGEW